MTTKLNRDVKSIVEKNGKNQLFSTFILALASKAKTLYSTIKLPDFYLISRKVVICWKNLKTITLCRNVNKTIQKDMYFKITFNA